MCSLVAAQAVALGVAGTTVATTSASSATLDKALKDADTLLRSGSPEKAETLVRDYLKSRSDSADGHNLLGLILFREAKPKESLAEFTAGAAIRTPSAFELKIVALDYVLLHDYLDAAKWLSNSLALNPKDAEGWYYLGRTKYQDNRFQEAIDAFKRCLALDPQNVKAEDNLGLSLQGLGQVQEAMSAFQTALSWEKDSLLKDPGPLINLGSLFLEKNQPERAIAYLEEAAKLAPEDRRVHEQLGMAYQHVNELSKAQAELERAVQVAPDNVRLHFILGQIYRREGMMDKAKAELDRYEAGTHQHSTDAQ